MNSNKPYRGLYVITDNVNLEFEILYSKTEEILSRGIFALQFRDKAADFQQRVNHARKLQQLCIAYKTLFIVNDDIDIVQQLDSDGLHLGKDDTACNTARELIGAGKIIGVSCYNSLQRAEKAVADGADYIAFGAMFPTSSKDGTEKATPDLITIAKQKYDVPVAAIGGITPDNCVPLIDAGADMLAVISSVYQASNPGDVVDYFNQLMSMSK